MCSDCKQQSTLLVISSCGANINASLKSYLANTAMLNNLAVKGRL